MQLHSDAVMRDNVAEDRGLRVSAPVRDKMRRSMVVGVEFGSKQSLAGASGNY